MKCDKCGQEIDVNADGDSIEQMRAVQKRFGVGAVDHFLGTWWNGALWDFDDPVDRYRIAAKHADKFDPAKHDWQTWKAGVKARGLVLQRTDCTRNGEYSYDDGGIFPCPSCTFTAVTPARRDAELAAAKEKAAWSKTRWSVTQDGTVFEYDTPHRWRSYDTDGSPLVWEEYHVATGWLNLPGEREITEAEARALIAAMKPQEERVEIVLHGNNYVFEEVHAWWSHYMAQSKKGFIEYEYANGTRSTHPRLPGPEGKPALAPVAWWKAK
jgi:hypothetical protein